MNKMTLAQWVRDVFLFFFRLEVVPCSISRAKIKTTSTDHPLLGIIPRAAQMLFEKLEGSKHNRTQSTGLRTPARYSIGTPQGLNKPPVDRNWQLKATYVEVWQGTRIKKFPLFPFLTMLVDLQ